MKMILAIDPGEHAGWAVTDNYGNHLTSGIVAGDNVHACHHIIKSHMPDKIVIEDQFPGKASAKGLKTLIRRATIWEVLAAVDGIEVLPYVNPSTWQAYHKIKGKGVARKNAIIKWASMIIGKSTQPDESDAILIGIWQVAQLSNISP